MPRILIDYSNLKAEIVKQYGTISRFCDLTKSIDNTYLSRILSNKIQFSQQNILIVAKALNISGKDFKSYFFTEKV